MKRQIIEYGVSFDVVTYKNVYTIVYENKTYYYCKVNGTDDLKHFRKVHEAKQYGGTIYFTNENVQSEEEVNAHFRELKLSQLKRKIEHTEIQIATYKEAIISEENHLKYFRDELSRVEQI